MTPAVLFFGGNGHCAARLEPAREALARLARDGEVEPFTLQEVEYPGFEGRPAARDREAFLQAVGGHAERRARGAVDAAIYATGIGALFTLALRAQGALDGLRVVMQGAVLWGLERRVMPRLLRAGLAPLLPALLRTPLAQRAFARRHFLTPPSASERAAFFAGYARCAAAADLFRWLNPAFLRDLEERLATRPQALRGIELWRSGRDRVVDEREARWTQAALGVAWPEKLFPEWGHYPMMDDPAGWIRTIARWAR